MDLTFFVLACATLYSVLLGFLVLKRNFKGSENIWFFVSSVSAAIWVLTNLFVDYSRDIGVVLWSARFTLIGPIILGPSFYIFTKKFTRPQEKFSVLKKILIITGSLIFLFLVPTSLNIKSIELSGDKVITNIGVLYYIFAAYFIFYLISALVILIVAFIKEKGLMKQQLKFILWGALLTGIFGVGINLVLLILGHSEFATFGPISVLFFFTLTSYAIARHRLMDIRMVVARSVAYTILVATMAGIYAGGVIGLELIFYPDALGHFNWGVGIIRTLLAVIMAFSFQPLRKWITKITDKIFFKNQYDANEFLDTLSHTIGATIVLVELIFKTLELLKEQMKVSRGIMVILSESGAIYNSQNYGYGSSSVKVDSEDMQKLTKDGVLVYDELEENSRYKHLLRKYDASIAVPLKTENTTEGVLILGEKLSGDMYNQQDLKVFEIIAPELAVAITNAKAFEKIEKFNVTLRQEIKKATAELEKKNEQLRELDKAKDEFISMASHQLRTPLTAIKGYLSMLLEGDAGEIRVSQYDFVNEAFQGANRMVGLINDLLNVSRMETGRFFLEPVEVDLDRVVQEEVKQLENHAKEKKLTLKYEKKGKVPAIFADETKIRQVVMNFIDNAIYYTTNGGVTVTLEADKTHVTYKVTDTGIGVPKSQQKNLFTKFYRADNARHVRPDGTGLGIYLAKKVIDDHHGELIFKSEEGKGSTFGFKFPIHSKLKTKRVSAPMPSNLGPAIGELAAGIGVPAETLEATSAKPTDMSMEGIDVAKAAGIEKPLDDSVDKKEFEKETEKIKVENK